MKKILFSLALMATLVVVSCSTDDVAPTQNSNTNTLQAKDSTGGQLGDPNNPRPKP
ncbi:MAG: hypothetical protein RL607_2388 [Bacteroidota bacterium]|jgi:hypothetical protein